MEPGQGTGKTDATQGGPRRVEPVAPPGGTVTRPTGPGQPLDTRGGVGDARAREAAKRDRARLVMWSAVAIVLAAGLVLYFRYEHIVHPLMGGGR